MSSTLLSPSRKQTKIGASQVDGSGACTQEYERLLNDKSRVYNEVISLIDLEILPYNSS